MTKKVREYIKFKKSLIVYIPKDKIKDSDIADKKTLQIIKKW